MPSLTRHWPNCKHKLRSLVWVIERLDNFSVIYDACVLYPAPLRDALMSLAVTRLFRARWTEAIHDEWTQNLLDARPDIKPAQLVRTREVMNRAVPDAVVTGYEHLIETLLLPDKDDRHVLAAAVQAKAVGIITFNIKDFPTSVLSPLGIETYHPDDFIARLLAAHPAEVVSAFQQQRFRLARPPVSVEAFLETLRRQNLPKTVDLLRLYSTDL